MSQPRFTRGPWRVIDFEIYAKSESIADLTHSTVESDETVEGNARLIAASPALYEALKQAKETIRTFNGMGMSGGTEQACWEAYQRSPEMQQINAALALVEQDS